MSNALRRMRIIAVPLSRPTTRILPTRDKPSRLTYYQFQINNPRIQAPSSTGEKGAPETKEQGGWPEEGLVEWATKKAAETWAGFGKAEGGWKLKVFQAGERLVDRMDFEELALKSIDPSFGPSITPLKGSSVLDEKQKPNQIPLIFPPSILSPSAALSDLRDYTAHRIPSHRRGFYMWMFLAPFTAPLIIIPIIPNLPFFFCVWRSWSHYRAYKSSQYLQSLIEHDLLVPEENVLLDAVYKNYAPPSTIASSDSSTTSTPEAEPKHSLLLSKDAVPSILSIFDLEPAVAADLYRAIKQVELRAQDRGRKS